MSRKPIAVLLLMLTLCGCDKRIVEDVSAQSPYREAIGARYEVIGPLDAYGIKRDLQQGVEYITLIPPPGISGPEVGFRVPVRTGSTIEVLRAVRTNILSDSPFMLFVRLDGTPMPIAVKVQLDLYRGNEAAEGGLLNPRIYRELARSGPADRPPVSAHAGQPAARR